MIAVPDAFVILKWVLEGEDEPGHDQAMELQEALLAEEIEIRMPTPRRYEVGNVLGMKKPKIATELMSALLAYEFDEVPPEHRLCACRTGAHAGRAGCHFL
jgi:hypothetical protein